MGGAYLSRADPVCGSGAGPAEAEAGGMRQGFPRVPVQGDGQVRACSLGGHLRHVPVLGDLQVEVRVEVIQNHAICIHFRFVRIPFAFLYRFLEARITARAESEK